MTADRLRQLAAEAGFEQIMKHKDGSTTVLPDALFERFAALVLRDAQAPAEGDAEFHQLGCLKGMLEDDEGARHSCTCGAKTSPTRDQLFTALNEVAELVGDCEEWAITEDPQVVVGMVKDYMAGVALSKAQPKGTDVPQGPRTEFVLNELRSALSAMTTFFGMDEDEASKPTFDKARQALNYAEIVMRPLEPWERQSLDDFRACAHRWHEKAVAKGYDGVEAMCDTALPYGTRDLRLVSPSPAPVDGAARYPHPDEDDAVTLWAEIHRLRAAVRGPDGYESWQDAATAERVRRVAGMKVMRQALEALQTCMAVPHWPSLCPTIEALRAALGEQP